MGQNVFPYSTESKYWLPQVWQDPGPPNQREEQDCAAEPSCGTQKADPVLPPVDSPRQMIIWLIHASIAQVHLISRSFSFHSAYGSAPCDLGSQRLSPLQSHIKIIHGYTKWSHYQARSSQEVCWGSVWVTMEDHDYYLPTRWLSDETFFVVRARKQ